MSDIYIKRGDVGNTIVRRLWEHLVDETVNATTGVVTQTDTFQPINLSTATTVRLLLKDQAGASTGGGTCTITNATLGEVSYTTQTADVTAVRVWNAEYEITFPAGRILTVPASGYFTVEVTPDLGGA